MTLRDHADRSPDQVVQRDPSVLWRRCLDGVLIRVEAADASTLLGPPGDAIWEHLEQPIHINELVDSLAEQFTGDRAQIEEDVIEYLRQLAAYGATREL